VETNLASRIAHGQEKAMGSEDIGFERLGPAEPTSPLVCAVPHAGRFYPPELRESNALPWQAIEDLEDRYADRLIDDLLAMGAVAIVARTARAWIDLNRGEEDLEPALRLVPNAGPPPSARSRSGLGLIPRRIGRRELWRRLPAADDVAARIATLHRPYHQAIAHALGEAHARFGFALLLDCHSMPPLARSDPPRIVIGDRHGTTASAAVRDALISTARRAGLVVACNAPYAGAYGIEHHGRPADFIHAVQVEIDRTLYLERDRRAISDQLPAVQALIARMARAALDAAQPLAIAAE
jgi:N-formylglutamate amidohydrolase